MARGSRPPETVDGCDMSALGPEYDTVRDHLRPPSRKEPKAYRTKAVRNHKQSVNSLPAHDVRDL